MATNYGPATGNYSAQSIRDARNSGGTRGTRILDVGSNGKAPADARIGDYIRTAGGAYQIIGGTNGNWQTAKEGTAGYGSINTDAGSSYTKSNPLFDTQGIYDSMIKAKNALLEQQYNTDLNNLTKNYDTNITNAENTKASVQQDYLNQVEGINQNTYNELQRSKEFGVQRGVTNSALGRAQDQTMLRAGADTVDNATTERNRVITEISNKINDLTSAFGGDKATLSSNLGSAKLQAMSEAQLAKLNTDLSLYKQNVDWDNQFKMNDINNQNAISMAKLQQGFAIDLNKLSFEQQKQLQQLSSDAQARLAKISAGSSASQFNASLQREYNNSQTNVFMEHFSPYTAKYGAKTSKMYDLALLNLSNGTWDYNTAYNNLVSTYKAEGAKQ